MKICFIWIEKFKGFSKYGLNLSSDFFYYFDVSSGLISRTPKEKIPRIFGDGISEITALLGVNGAGKTNALELICRILKSPEKLTHKYLVVYETSFGLHYRSSLTNIHSNEFEISHELQARGIRNLDVIYFSNVFDRNFLDFGDNVFDVSINNKNNTKKIAAQRGGREFEIQNDLVFLNSPEFSRVNLDPPAKIEIKVEKFLSQKTRSMRPSNPVIPSELIQYLADIRKMERGKNPLRLATLIIQIEFFLGLINSSEKHPQIVEFMTKWVRLEGVNQPGIGNFIRALDAFFAENYLAIPWAQDSAAAETFSVLLNLEHLFEQMGFAIEDSHRGPRYVFTIDYDHSVNHFYQRIACILRGVRFSSIAWTNVSSGQKAYLNLFSSIWGALNMRSDGIHSGQPALICIDEGDLYLHPQWQIEFIERLITGLPTVSKSEIQIVISTHSPILISDLPHQCVVSLSRENSAAFVSDQAFARPRTFGANLFDIYEFAFGLQKQRTGNLSAKYISKLLQILDIENLSPDDISELELGLSIVDNELIAHHINKRIKEK